MTAGEQHHLSLRAVFREIFTVYRRHWAFLIAGRNRRSCCRSPSWTRRWTAGTSRDFRSAKDIALFGAVLLTAAVNLVGQAIYAGLTAAADVDWRAGKPLPPLSTLIRSLPIGGLIVLDLLVSIGVAIGILLLVVPGLIFLAYVGISPAVMKLEHRGPLDACRRSVELVRGNFRRVFAIVVGVILITELAVQAITFPFHGLRPGDGSRPRRQGSAPADRGPGGRRRRDPSARAARRGGGPERDGEGPRPGSRMKNGPPP